MKNDETTHYYGSVFAAHMADFIRYKRAQGLKYDAVPRFLRSFSRFLSAEEADDASIGQELIAKWCSFRPNENRLTQRRRIVETTQFLKYLSERGVNVHLPRPTRKSLAIGAFVPYIFSNEELRRFFVECDRFSARTPSVTPVMQKKGKSGTINYMSPEGIKLILEQPNAKKMSGRRDMVLLSLMYDSGARVQEMADISVRDFRAEPPATIKITGKGGKTRIVPLMEPTATIVRQYISETGLTGGGKHSYPMFPNRHGERLTRAGIKYILDKCVESARNKNPGVLPGVISPHTFRHSKAMHLLHAGVNLVYIRDILGHADLKTTEIYARTSMVR